jgi:hypothetical protein
MGEKESQEVSNLKPLHAKCLETTNDWAETTSFHGKFDVFLRIFS